MRTAIFLLMFLGIEVKALITFSSKGSKTSGVESYKSSILTINFVSNEILCPIEARTLSRVA